MDMREERPGLEPEKEEKTRNEKLFPFFFSLSFFSQCDDYFS